MASDSLFIPLAEVCVESCQDSSSAAAVSNVVQIEVATEWVTVDQKQVVQAARISQQVLALFWVLICIPFFIILLAAHSQVNFPQVDLPGGSAAVAVVLGVSTRGESLREVLNP